MFAQLISFHYLCAFLLFHTNMFNTFFIPSRLVCFICCIWMATMLCAKPISSVPTRVDSLLIVYDQEIEHAWSYIEQRNNYIDSVKANSDMTRAESQIAIAKLYIPYQCDSALFYLSQATNASDYTYATEAKLYLIYLLASIGYYNEGFLLSHSLNPLPATSLSLYHEALSHLHGEAFVYGKMNTLKAYHNQQAALHKDSLFMNIRQKHLSPTYISKYGWKENEWLELQKLQLIQARNQQDYQRAIDISNQVFEYVAPIRTPTLSSPTKRRASIAACRTPCCISNGYFAHPSRIYGAVCATMPHHGPSPTSCLMTGNWNVP